MQRHVALVGLLLGLATACQNAPLPGAACTTTASCTSPLVCRFGRCRSECSASRDCPPAARCLLTSDGTGVCSLDVDQGCESAGGTVCPTGLVCIADRCEQACSGSLGCAPGAVCTPAGAVSYCAPVGGDDAAIVDASLDAVSVDAGTDATRPDAGPGSGVRLVCVGDGFACASVAPSDEVYCWGQDAAHALGGAGAGCSADRSDVATPLQVSNLSDVDQLVCGRSWACAHVRGDGSVRCWGESNWGTTIPTLPSSCDRTPQPIAGVSSTSGELSATSQLVCVTDAATDAVRCWGGDLGTLVPEDVAPGSVYVQLADVTALSPGVRGGLATPRHLAVSEGMPNVLDGTGGACAIDATGDVYCWGHNRFGQVGSTPSAAVTSASHVVGMSVAARSIVTTSGFTCALGSDDQVWCWGIDAHGELARPPSDPSVIPSCLSGASTSPCSDQPRSYAGIHFSAISSVLTAAVCGIATSGAGGTPGDVYCWGSREFGIPGTTTTSVADPLDGHILRSDGSPLGGIAHVSVGWRDACAIDAGGALWCWGDNDHLQLQDTADRSLHTRAVAIHVP